jgi:hypothetical protein
MKVIDAFIFYNEIEILKYRLEYLNDSVDMFVLVEARLTFTGKPKELYYEKNKHLFEEYNHKILHVVVDMKDFMDEKISPWDREKYQRNYIKNGLEQLNLNDEDIIILSDTDEIPNVNAIEYVKNFNYNNCNCIFMLEQDFYYYNLNTIATNNYKWYFSKIGFFKDFKKNEMEEIRHKKTNNNYEVINNGGWHFSYFGSPEFIKNKIMNFSHQEFANETYTNREHINYCINNNKDLFNRDYIHFRYISFEENKNLPKDYQKLVSYFS